MQKFSSTKKRLFTTFARRFLSPQVTPFFHESTFTCSYVVACPNTRQAIIVDPAADFAANSGRLSYGFASKLLNFVAEQKLQVKLVLETHVHADHISSAKWLQQHLDQPDVAVGSRITEVQEVFSEVFEDPIPCDGSQFDVLLKDGEVLPLGDLDIRVMATPGHTPACTTYVIGDAAFTGDTLFMPDVGSARCDFPGGDASQLWDSIQSILSLPEDTRLYVGHDYPKEREVRFDVTVKEQRENNIHLKGVDEKAYIEMRRTRDAQLDAPKLLLPSLQ
ncbi:MAG: hypothetical protein MHM6MM_006002, partial [Cercozoa sp. M6MM]